MPNRKQTDDRRTLTQMIYAAAQAGSQGPDDETIALQDAIRTIIRFVPEGELNQLFSDLQLSLESLELAEWVARTQRGVA